MSTILRPYQIDVKNGVYSEWEKGNKNICLVMPTGSGKTAVTANVVSEHRGATCVIAHRQELVSQLSMALARAGVRHRIVGPANIVKLCVRLHMEEIGKSYFDPNSTCAVAGVDTLVRRTTELAQWLKSVTLWVTDECHHILGNEPDTCNKWGTAVRLFPNAKGLGVTATPQRADGKGLGSHHDGVMDSMVIGPTMRDLISLGYLTEYRIFAPPSDLDLSAVTVSASGDYSRDSLTKATRKSHVMGDVVTHYLRIAKGKLGITFATDVQSAKELAEQFTLAGVPAVALDAKTPDSERIAVLKRFKNREILQIVNVDLFSEGFDLPAIEVVSMARATQSYGMYVQIFGRALRPLKGKSHAIIIDHVSNVVRHGLPDAPKSWSLDRREARSKKNDPDAIPVKACPECTAIYERIYKACPYCGFEPIPSIRSAPEHVDGDLHELDPETLKRMRGEIEEATMTAEEKRLELAMKHVPYAGQLGGVNKHKERLIALNELRDQMAWWGGYHTAKGRPDSEIQRRFYFKFGIDVLSAQALRTKEAIDLRDRVAIDNSVNIAYNV